MNWSALTKKQQQMAVITIVLAIAQVFLMAHFLGWTKPSSARNNSGKKELADLQTKLDDARLILRQQETIRNELSKSIDELGKLTVYTPTLSDRYAWAYEYVSRCARQSGIELDSLEEILYLEDKKNKSDPSLRPYEITVSTRCGYNNLVEFLWRLEKGNPLLLVKEVRISAVRDDPQFQLVRIVIRWPASVEIKGKKE